MSRWAGLVAAALALGPTCALAWPVDWGHEVGVGKEKFLKLPKVDWFEVDDPTVLSAEWFEGSNELVLSGLKAGRALVLLGADGKVAAWSVRVGVPPKVDEAVHEAARKACQAFRPAPAEDVKLTVTVQNEACASALRALFQTDQYEARGVELEFEGGVLQAQLAALQAAFAKVSPRLTARYVGAGLVVEGSVSAKEHRAMLWAILRHGLGRFALDDRCEVEPEAAPVDAGVLAVEVPDAGTPVLIERGPVGSGKKAAPAPRPKK